MRRTYKKLMALCAVLVFSLSLIPVTAYAQDPFTAVAIGGLNGLSGAGLFSSMASASGVNIGWGQSGSDSVDAMWNKLNPDHVYFSGEKHEATGTGEDVYDYITVDIGDWLSAQSDFITAFIQDNNITDNDSGTITQNTFKEFNGIPLYIQSNTYLFSDIIDVAPTFHGYSPSNVSMSGGGVTITITYVSGNTHTFNYYYNGTLLLSENLNLQYMNYTFSFRLRGTTYASSVWIDLVQNGNSWRGVFIPNTDPPAAENITYTSNTVDTNVFDNYGSAKIKIPTGSLQSGWTIADFFSGLNEIWANGEQEDIIIEDGDAPSPSPPIPVPTLPLGEVPFDEWLQSYGDLVSQAAQNIEEDVNDIPGLIQDSNDTLTNIDTNIIDIEDTVESIDTNIEDATDTLESIDTNIGVGNGILSGIRSLVSGFSDTISDIADAVQELVQEVVLATETFVAGLLNTIPQAFGGWFQTMKQSFSIWHYVVEWFNSISGVFGWFWTVASGTSYYIVLPIYASLAGAVVLAFYKRFGK